MIVHGRLLAYVVALYLTIVIEAPIYAFLIRTTQGVAWRRGLLAGTLVNLVSHPVVFLVVFPFLQPIAGALAALALVEAIAVLVEACLLWTSSRDKPLALLGMSYVANGASLSFGLLFLR